MAPLACGCSRWLGVIRSRWCAPARALSRLCLLLLSLHFFATVGQSQNDQQSAEAFIVNKVGQVRQIAEAAVDNWKKAMQQLSPQECGQLPNICSSNCSRDECWPLARDLDELACVPILTTGNYPAGGCPVTAGMEGKCDNKIRASFQEGYVRIPTSLRNPRDGSVSYEMDFNVCAQHKLDDTLKQLHNSKLEDESTYFHNFYFASVDGFMRTFPGQQGQCTQDTPSEDPYDPRNRPWYVGAISVVHDLVVLLDCGASMALVRPLDSAQTPFAYARNMTVQLLATLSHNTTVTIFTFNDSAAGHPVGSIAAPDGSGQYLDTTAPLFKALLKNITDSDQCFGSSQGGISNITAGLNLAIESLTKNSGDPSRLKIILLLTDGKSDESQDGIGLVSQQLDSHNIKLFYYQIGSTKDRGPVANISCHVEDNPPLLGEEHNFLYFMRSYFSFLALSHNASTEARGQHGLAFWQREYTDCCGLGSVITVAYLAISDEGELIGVAGIDLQTAGLQPGLGDQMDTIISDNPSTYPYLFSYPQEVALTCPELQEVTCTHDQTLGSLCEATLPISRPTDILCCCEGCGGMCHAEFNSKGAAHATDVRKVSVAVVVVVVGMLICGVIGFKGCKRWRKYKLKKDFPRPGRPTTNLRSICQ